MNKQQEHSSKNVKKEANENKQTATQDVPSPEENILLLQKEMESKFLSLQADFENYKKRAMKKEAEFLARANERLLGNIIPVMNDFERALSVKNAANNDNTLQGIKMIYEKLLHILAKEGIEPIEIKEGTAIQDEDLIEAISTVEVADEKQKGAIVQVIEKGYLFKGNPLVRTKVIIGR